MYLQTNGILFELRKKSPNLDMIDLLDGPGIPNQLIKKPTKKWSPRHVDSQTKLSQQEIELFRYIKKHY